MTLIAFMKIVAIIDMIKERVRSGTLLPGDIVHSHRWQTDPNLERRKNEAIEPMQEISIQQ